MSTLNRTTWDLYTSSPAVDSITVRPERSAAKSKARTPSKIALFDFAAHAATLRANGQKYNSTSEELSQRRVVWFRLDRPVHQRSHDGLDRVFGVARYKTLRHHSTAKASTRCARIKKGQVLNHDFSSDVSLFFFLLISLVTGTGSHCVSESSLLLGGRKYGSLGPTKPMCWGVWKPRQPRRPWGWRTTRAYSVSYLRDLWKTSSIFKGWTKPRCGGSLCRTYLWFSLPYRFPSEPWGEPTPLEVTSWPLKTPWSRPERPRPARRSVGESYSTNSTTSPIFPRHGRTSATRRGTLGERKESDKGKKVKRNQALLCCNVLNSEKGKGCQRSTPQLPHPLPLGEAGDGVQSETIEEREGTTKCSAQMNTVFSPNEQGVQSLVTPYGERARSTRSGTQRNS